MYLFIDTEFTDFVKMDMMSLGIVSEDGKHEFYVEIIDHDVDRRSDFVNKVICPLMDLPKYGKTRAQAAIALLQWLDTLPTDHVTVVADYTGDVTLFDRLMSHVPESTTQIYVKLLNEAFTHMLMSRGIHSNHAMVHAYAALMNETSEYFKIDPRQHHALVDAKALRHGWLAGYKAGYQ